MLKPGHVVALCVLTLLCLGVVMVNSAMMDVTRTTTVSSVLTSRASVYLALAVIALFVVSRLPLLRLIPGVNQTTPPPLNDQQRGGWTLWPLWGAAGALICCLLLVYIPGFGREVNGASRWLSVPLPVVREVSVQPSEIAKWGMIGLVAWYAWRVGAARLTSMTTGVLPVIAAMSIVCIVIVKEDLGTAVLIMTVGALILMAAGARIWHFALAVPLGAAAFAAAVITSPYRVERILSFLDPYADPMGRGYHMIQSLSAVSAGEGFGRGLGNGLNKFDYLPEDQTDFIFAVICEELGIPGALLVAVLYAGLIWAGISIVRAQRHTVLRLIGLGIISTVALQAIINMAVVTGLAPTKGIALPLLSAGGTGWILTAGSLGLLINMDRFVRAQRASGTLLPASMVEAKPTQQSEPVVPSPHRAEPATL